MFAQATWTPTGRNDSPAGSGERSTEKMTIRWTLKSLDGGKGRR